jgi:hypothetical protein
MTGTAVMANTSRLNSQLFSFNIDGVLLVPARLRLGSGFGSEHGAQRYVVFATDAVTPITL